MASMFRSALKMIKEKGISNLWKEAKQEGFVDALLDGNLMLISGCLALLLGHVSRETKLHSIGATLVGVDRFGNKYYEKLENTQFGRHRWVEYGDKKRYDASQVPAEWHGWLHHITDHTAEQLQMFKPKRYGAEHRPNLTGYGDDFTYHSKGHTLNPKQRDWTRYEPWQPTNV